MKRLRIFMVAAFIAAVLGVIYFGDVSFLRNTTPVYLKPDTAPGVETGARVKLHSLDVGYVHKIELASDGGLVIELRIFDDIPLHKTDVCVIHRLHRYDTASLQIERSVESDTLFDPLGDPPVMRCVIANGPWPHLPGLTEQIESK